MDLQSVFSMGCYVHLGHTIYNFDHAVMSYKLGFLYAIWSVWQAQDLIQHDNPYLK